MTFRGPGFLGVVRFGSSPPSLSRQQIVSLSQSSCVSPVHLNDGRGGGRGAEIIRPQESLGLYSSFTLLCRCRKFNGPPSKWRPNIARYEKHQGFQMNHYTGRKCSHFRTVSRKPLYNLEKINFDLIFFPLWTLIKKDHHRGLRRNGNFFYCKFCIF